jgi:hypothetical protein
MPAEEELRRDPVHLTGIAEEFCTRVLPWYYTNNRAPKDDYAGSKSEGDDIFVPALWRPGTLIACSVRGYTTRRLKLPHSWARSGNVRMALITIDGLEFRGSLPIQDGEIQLTLAAGEAASIERQ